MYKESIAEVVQSVIVSIVFLNVGDFCGICQLFKVCNLLHFLFFSLNFLPNFLFMF